jgi:uncharacterized membrane protein YeaQ/YmgE (transglycosylase-associated protein family)
MTILGWILLGLISGFIASKVVTSHGQGCLTDIALGLVGALVGGFLFQIIGGRKIGGEFDLYSLFVATIGAIIVLVVYHMIMGRRTLK